MPNEVDMRRLEELMNLLPPELLEESTTGRDLIDAIIDEAYKDGIRKYAWWKDGVQYVGHPADGVTLEEVLETVC